MALKERMDSPFSKGREIPLAGRLFSWRGQGEDKFPFPKGNEIPPGGTQFYGGARGRFP